MGSFNVSCALSSLSIHEGDPCYFIPLISEQYSKASLAGGGSFICSNEGAEGLFRVPLLPIKGKYADYGSMDNIEDNDNAKFIEKLFDTTIHEFIRDASLFHMGKKGSERPLQGCFIHEFAYDAAIKYAMNEKYCGHSILSRDVTKEALEYIGFELVGENDDTRYKYSYQINGIEDYEIRTDNKYSHLFKCGDEIKEFPNDSVYTVKKMKDLWLKRTGEELKLKYSDEELLNKNVYDLVFDKKVLEIKEKIESEETLKTLKKQMEENPNDEDLKEGHQIAYAMVMWKSMACKGGFTDFPYNETYQELFVADSKDIKRLIGEFNCLRSYMYQNCKLFQPNSLGPQCGELKAEKTLLTASMKFVDAKMEEYEEEEYE
jgi:hypothetical protein